MSPWRHKLQTPVPAKLGLCKCPHITVFHFFAGMTGEAWEGAVGSAVGEVGLEPAQGQGSEEE